MEGNLMIWCFVHEPLERLACEYLAAFGAFRIIAFPIVYFGIWKMYE